jgi:hypothetical protein
MLSLPKISASASPERDARGDALARFSAGTV